MEDEENNEGSKKIALKVPSLFFPSKVKEKEGANEEENGGVPTPIVKRPMPASARRKLEEAVEVQRSESPSGEVGGDSSQAQENGERSETVENDEGGVDGQEESQVSQESEEPEPVKVQTSPKKSRPMPASARRKLEEANGSVEDEKEKTETPKVVKRAMPASGPEGMDGDKETERAASEKAMSSMDEGSESESSQGKKINISLGVGGIKFPSFKAPAPPLSSTSSTSKDATTSQRDKTTKQADEDEEESEARPNRSSRSRSSATTNDLVALEDSKYQCQYCDIEFYNLYSKKKHEENHFKVKEDPPKKESFENKSKPKPKKDFTCPYCNEEFRNSKKLKNHKGKCKLKCRICSINFKNLANLTAHNEQIHSGNNEDNSQQSQDISQDLGSESEEDIFEKVSLPPTPKSTSKSVKSKASSDNDEPSERSKNVDSFKKKIADVLCNLGNSNFKKRKREESEKESDESDVDSPPTKKIVLSKEKGRAMPASILKKLEKKSQPVKKPAKEIHDLECEVCHRVFSNGHNRLRHERDVHSLKNPRSGAGTSASKGVDEKKEGPRNDTSKALRLEDLPISGRCPICSKFIGTRLRRHVRNVHKIGPDEDVNSPKPTPIAIRGSGQKSYNIYRSAADKAKKRLVSPVKRHEKEDSEDEPLFKPVAVPAKKTPAPASKSSQPTDFKCGCCDKTFTVKVDFNEHMLRRHPKNKRLITCSLCLHQFSHEEDFILHMQFRHKELISGMIEKDEGESGSKPKAIVPKPAVPKSQPSTSGLGPASRRFLRKTEETNEAQAACKPFTVKITNRERSLAENFKKKERKRPGPAFTKKRSPSPEPEPMDTYYDEGPASPVTFEEEVEETVGIAITSTFSQRKESNELRMPCSTCTEVFYSFEALRKHELYFHNVKTSQMCPICGVYPMNLSKHLKEHEEKSANCGCSLCQINFADFSILLKHNLKHHPGPDAKRVNGDEEDKDEMAEILKETNKKLADNDWDEDSFDVVSSMLMPVPEKKKRPMPASMKEEKKKEEVEKPKPKLRGPMPASVRAKIEQKKAEQMQKEENPPKTARPMPASMRAKSQAIPSPATSSVSSSSKPKARPMPASVRARIMNKAELKEVAPPATDNYSPPPSPVDLSSDNEEKRNDGKSAEVVTLSDDDDIAVIEERVKPRGPDSFNIADEIAEHNRAVQMAMGEVPKRKDNVQVHFKCKLCLRTFDTQDGIRRHIRRGHSEYGPEHTENLYEQVFQEAQVSSDAPRRRSNVNYNKSYNHDEDDIEEEVIVNRGTSTRPRGLAVADPDYNQSEMEIASPAISHSVEGMDSNLLLYACKYCGKRMDSHGNVRRHIGKAHPAMRGVDENDVVMLEVGKENEFVPSNEHLVAVVQDEVQQEFGQAQMPQPVAYKCKICQKTMEKRASLMQHIGRSHPEIKSGRNSTSFIQEIYENELLNSVMGGEEEKAGETYACGFCTFETNDEHEYVSHYKQHTGVSPYNCQYCSATFNKSEQLTAHISREHTGSEFLNTDEAEISMEEMVGVGEISVSSATPILIENPKMITLNRGFSEKKKGRAGPASKTRRRSGAKEQEQINSDTVEEVAGEDVLQNEHVEQEQGEGEEQGGEDDTQSTENNVDDNENEEMEVESESLSLPYQGDLSSLFPSLGGMALGTMADIDGGMDLD